MPLDEPLLKPVDVPVLVELLVPELLDCDEPLWVESVELPEELVPVTEEIVCPELFEELLDVPEVTVSVVALKTSSPVSVDELVLLVPDEVPVLVP